MWIAFSVDLEPNKDGSLTGVREAARWVAEAVPAVTFYTTYRIATEAPELVADLATDHEIGVHVHPREFEYEHDQFARLSADEQRDLLTRTRTALADAAGCDTEAIDAFRAGRHSASETTFKMLADSDFALDASINVRYDRYLPAELRRRQTPFTISSGLLMMPTTWVRPSLFSPAGWRTFPTRNLTATASTLRTDSPICSGQRAVQYVLDHASGVSMYMHPYDATDYDSDLTNNGETFRERLTAVLSAYDDDAFLTSVDLLKRFGQ